MAEETITVGLVVERIDLTNPWVDHAWMPTYVFPVAPETPDWTVLRRGQDRMQYYAGAHTITLYAGETAHYRDNLMSERPSIWVGLRPEGREPPVMVLRVTVDPTEGEGLTETGTNVVERIDMPPEVAAWMAAFVEAHHVERVFEKRQRDKRPPRMAEGRGPRTGDKGRD